MLVSDTNITVLPATLLCRIFNSFKTLGRPPFFQSSGNNLFAMFVGLYIQSASKLCLLIYSAESELQLILPGLCTVQIWKVSKYESVFP